MRFLRAAIIGGLCFFPATIIGYIFWLILGASNDNYSFEVVFACNLIPIFGMMYQKIKNWTKEFMFQFTIIDS